MAFKSNTVIIRFLNADIDTKTHQLKWTNQKYMLGYHDYQYYIDLKTRAQLQMKQIVLITNEHGTDQPAVIIAHENVDHAKTKHVPIKNYTKFNLGDYLKQYHQGPMVIKYANQEFNQKVGNYQHRQQKLKKEVAK